VLTEAMAAGLPVVALDASGVREVVRDGKNGFLLEAGADENSFAACLEKIKSNAELKKRLKAGARRTAQIFSQKRSAEKALVFYEKIRLQTRPEHCEEKESAWIALAKRIEVEWRLISQKTKSVITAVFADQPAKTKPTSKDSFRKSPESDLALDFRSSTLDQP
ncbi:MAG: glycosyltransferase, partial [Limisphaerales bacterium]